jgi:hypothetical protein
VELQGAEQADDALGNACRDLDQGVMFGHFVVRQHVDPTVHPLEQAALHQALQVDTRCDAKRGNIARL